jgi:hypothetical protein
MFYRDHVTKALRDFNSDKKKCVRYCKVFSKNQRLGWRKLLSKIKDAPTYLNPVIGLAAKDATILVAACLLGKITL